MSKILLAMLGVLVVLIPLLLNPTFMFQWSGVGALVCFVLVGILWFLRRQAQRRL
jgi:membrane protein implicated in regulation of membrane protease activity